MFGDKQKDLERQKLAIQKELDAIQKEKDAVEKIKSDKLAKRQKLELDYANKCKFYSANKTASQRLLAFIINYVRTGNPESISETMQKNFRVYSLLQKLDELGDKPLEKPSFDSENNPVVD